MKKKLSIEDTQKGDKLIEELLELWKQRKDALSPTKIKTLKAKIKKKQKEFYLIIENNKRRIK